MSKLFARVCESRNFALTAFFLVSAAIAQSPQSDLPGTAELADAVDTREMARFVSEILAVHPDLKGAKASLDEANAFERSAGRPIYNPELEADYENAVDKTYTVGISQTVDWFGKKNSAHSASIATRRAMESSFELARNNLAADLLDSLTRFWAATSTANLAVTTEGVMHDFAKQARMRYQAGDLMPVEYETAELAYVEARMRTAKAAADLSGIVHALASIGAAVNPNDWPVMPGRMPAATLDPIVANNLIQELPQVLAANALIVAAAAEVELAERNKKPDPTFGLRVGEEADDSLVGLSFSIPLYIRNSFDADLSASIAAQSRAEADADSVERSVRARLMTAIESYTTMRSAWGDWEKVGSVSLQRRTDLLFKLWEAREIDMSDFLLQFRQTLEAQQSAVELRQVLWEAWVDYLRESNQTERWLGMHNYGPVADIRNQNTGNPHD